MLYTNNIFTLHVNIINRFYFIYELLLEIRIRNLIRNKLSI